MAKDNNTVWIVVLIAVLALFLFVMPFGGGRWGGFCGMMGSYGANYGWTMMSGFGWIFMPAVLIALVLLIIWLIKQLQTPNRRKK